MPRRPGRQRNKSNVPANTPEEFYRRSVFIPFLEQIITYFEKQFTQPGFQFLDLQSFVPSQDGKVSTKCRTAAYQYYKDILPTDVVDFESERERWDTKWTGEDTYPSTVVEVLGCCDKEVYPRIHVLLQIFATLPVTSASAERSFSVLKLMKTNIRSTMGEERLNGLSMMCMHRDIPIDIEAAITTFAQSPRKLDFVI